MPSCVGGRREGREESSIAGGRTVAVLKEGVPHAEEHGDGERGAHKAREHPLRGDERGRDLELLEVGDELGVLVAQQLAQHALVDERHRHGGREVARHATLDDGREAPEGGLLVNDE